MAICSEVVPPEAIFDGVRVACHLYPAGSDGRPVTTPPPNAIGATAPLVVPPSDQPSIDAALA
jgi:hypothetical protein